MKAYKPQRYRTALVLLVLLSLTLGVVVLGTAFQIRALEWFSGLMDFKPYDPLFAFSVTGALALLALITYWIGLNPAAPRRPLGLVFLNLIAPCLFLALAIVGHDHAANGDITWYTFGLAPAVAFAPPLLLLWIEAMVHRSLRGMGCKAQDRGWRKLAVTQLGWALAFRPEDRETRRRCGMICFDLDECEMALRMLAMLGPVAQSEDEEVLRAQEHCQRALGNTREALRALLRLLQLKPDQTRYDRRILEDYLKLDMKREALELLESGRIRLTLELMQTAERLNLALGHYAQAMAQIRLIEREEGKPHNHSIRLYREMLAKLPEHVEVRISLGMLLVDDDNEERRREGAALLEDVLAQDPHRLHLARRLIHYYTEANQPKAAQKHLRLLVEAGDHDPEYHLAYAQALHEEERHAEAAEVLQTIVKRWPEDWRGHMRLARAMLNLDRLDEAEEALNRTTASAPQEAAPLLEPIRTGLEQRRRELLVMSMRSEVANNGFDVEKRLELIDHQIGMEWVDEALAECDRLLDESPELLPAITAHLEEGLRRAPRSFSLRDYLSDIYFQIGRYDDALRLYREMAEQSLHPAQILTEGCKMIIERAPEHMDARRELALTRRGEEDWAGVIEALDPPVQNEAPIPAEDKALWVEASWRLTRLDGAVRIGMTIVDDLIEEVGFILMMLDILMAAKEYDKALEVFMKAKAANPQDGKLARLENKVIAARARHHLGELTRKLQLEGELTPEEHYEKAEFHRTLGQNDESIVHYQRAAYAEELMPLATAKLADTLCERGMFELADETLNALELTRELADAHPELKAIMYRVGRQLERMRYFDKAAKYYKRVFRVDAAFEDVVERIDRLS